jgi:hypothetical protein
MKRLIVRLSLPELAPTIPRNGSRRPSPEQVRELAERTQLHVEKCADDVRRALGHEVRVEPMDKLGLLILTCAATADVGSIKAQAMSACPDVQSITGDIEIAAL